MNTVEHKVLDFRRKYQSQAGRLYSGTLHCTLTGSVLLGGAFYALTWTRNISFSETLTVPCTFLVANFFEYVFHRWMLHQPVFLLRPIYKIHTWEHHQYYTDEAIELETSQDFRLILFPPWAPLLEVAGLLSLAWFFVQPFSSHNVAGLFAATGILSFLLYEVIHLLDHLSDGWRITRISLFRRLREHHRIHHKLSLMARWNFNVTVPIGDLLFGTIKSVSNRATDSSDPP